MSNFSVCQSGLWIIKNCTHATLKSGWGRSQKMVSWQNLTPILPVGLGKYWYHPRNKTKSNFVLCSISKFVRKEWCCFVGYWPTNILYLHLFLLYGELRSTDLGLRTWVPLGEFSGSEKSQKWEFGDSTFIYILNRFFIYIQIYTHTCIKILNANK